jgi:hypothetical protein
MAAGPELSEDIRRAPDNVLSMIEPVYEVRSSILIVKWTLTYQNLSGPSTRIYLQVTESG